jgi:hypothetical protein
LRVQTLLLGGKSLTGHLGELRAFDIRIRASRRASELIAEGQKKGEIAQQGQPKKETSSKTTLLPRQKSQKLWSLSASAAISLLSGKNTSEALQAPSACAYFYLYS